MLPVPAFTASLKVKMVWWLVTPKALSTGEVAVSWGGSTSPTVLKLRVSPVKATRAAFEASLNTPLA